jgi:methionine-rich copper-binding protein CopC
MKNKLIALASILASMTAFDVWAHALLLQSTPKDHEQLKSSPEKVVLRFNGQIEKKVSQVTLTNKQGKKMTLPQAAQGFTSGSVDSLEIQLPKLTPGSYQLHYRILAMDGHTTPGLIQFSILEKATQ